MDIIFEIFFEIYGELMFLIVPEKNRSKKTVFLSKLIATLVLLGVVALAIWGLVLVFEYENMWGTVPVAAAVIVSLAQIIAGIVLYKRNH